MFARQLRTSALAAVFVLGASGFAMAQTTTTGFTANPGTTVSGGVVTLDSRGQPAGTSYENPNVTTQVKNGDTISFEYMGPCGGGAPRVFIRGGAFNTFDPDPNNTACGTDADGDGWFLVTQTITGITPGPAGAVGIVNDNIANPSVIQVRNLMIAGVKIVLTPAPRNAEECKNGGFAGGGFRNQGQCVSSFKRSR